MLGDKLAVGSSFQMRICKGFLVLVVPRCTSEVDHPGGRSRMAEREAHLQAL